MAKLNLQLETNIDVLDKYTQLVEASLSGDSVYIRAKETLDELFKDSVFDNKERGEIVAQVISSITGSITSNSMGTALSWASAEKNLFLQKTESEYRLSLLDEQGDKAIIDTEIAEAQKIAAQANNMRQFGGITLDTNGDVAALDNTGITYNQNESLKKDIENKVVQKTQLEAQVKQVNAGTHRTVADTYVNHGLFTGYTVTDEGIAGATKVDTGYVTLSELNKQVAKEQARGYALNAWSNANSGSASMIGTLIAAEVPGLDVTPYLNSWKTTNDNLTEYTPPVITI